jgi:hypothetical protein
MTGTQTIGIDTAKRVFFLHGESHSGGVVLRKKLTREQLLPFLANQRASQQERSNGLAVDIRGHGVRRIASRCMRV